jgi:hypothetical protein
VNETGSGHISGTVPKSDSKGLKKTTINTVRMAGIRPEIRTQDRQDM